MSIKKNPKPDINAEIAIRIKELNKSFKERIREFQGTETRDLPKVLPPAEELQELKMLIEWCLKLWAEHDGFIFKPGAYFNE